MFERFEKNMKRNLSLFIIAVFAIQFILIFYFYVTGLTEDFNDKSSHFNRQISNNIEAKLITVEKNINSLASNLDNDVNYNEFIDSVTNYTSLINGVFIVNKNKVEITSSADYKEYIDILDEFKDSDKNDGWILVEHRVIKGLGRLFYVLRLDNDSYFITEINGDNLFDNLNDKSNIFLDESKVNVRFSTGYSLFYDGDKISLVNSDNKIKNSGEITIFTNLDNRDIVITSTFSTNYITENAIVMALLMLIIFLAAYALARWGVKSLAEMFSCTLESLCEKMDYAISNIKKEKEVE